jgi:hypothetical protein
VSTRTFSAAAARDARDCPGATVPLPLLAPCFLWPLRPPVKDVLLPLFGGIFLGAGWISSFELRTAARQPCIRVSGGRRRPQPQDG